MTLDKSAALSRHAPEPMGKEDGGHGLAGHRGAVGPYAREQAAYDETIAARDAKTKATGKKPGGKPPAAPAEGPLPGDQVNLTDADSRIMPLAGGGFEQCYNAQAVVAAGSLLVVAADVVQAPNDKQQLEPMLTHLDALPRALGDIETLLADSGYASEANGKACAAAGIDPPIATGRQSHHQLLAEHVQGSIAARRDPSSIANTTSRSPSAN